MSATTMDDEEPPLKKNTSPMEPTSNPPLPDDLLVSCLARVSRLYYTALSLVSKRFRSLLTSQELYQARSLLGCSNSLYVCLQLSRTDPNPHWFMLRQKPNPTLTSDTRKKKNKKSSGYVLAKIPTSHSPPAQSALVAVGSNIYNIGATYDSPSSSVSILDCRSHTWRKAPSMQVERDFASAKFLDGKIYVTGGCYKNYNPSNWMEVFDLKTQTWEPVSSPAGSSRKQTDTVVLDGKLYIFGDIRAVYNPNGGTWNALTSRMDLRLNWSSSCVIENVLYYYNCGENFKWYNTKVRSWTTLKGVKRLRRVDSYSNVRLADYGGKMAVFWDKFVASGGGGGKNRLIWCSVIVLEKRNSDEIWGTFEWSGEVLPRRIHVEYDFKYVVAVTM